MEYFQGQRTAVPEHLPHDLAIGGQHQLPVLGWCQQLHQVHQIGAVELRGLGRQSAGEVGVANDGHAVVGRDDLTGAGTRDVAALR